MKRITLTVLSEDMKTANFMDIWDCPIMRAARRANLTLRYDQILQATEKVPYSKYSTWNSLGSHVHRQMSDWKERNWFNKIFPFFVTPRTFSFDILVEE